MEKVKPKKYLGQHFLTNPNIAKRIADSLSHHGGYPLLLEIGPGTGILTQYLLNDNRFSLKALDIDPESISYLKKKYKDHTDLFIRQDFLKSELDQYPVKSMGIIGNFPYNISSQIFFHILHYHDKVTEIVCMLQKEVADRIASPYGSRSYGILSVLLQTFYDIEFMFSVKPSAFHPPPRVTSGVIHLQRNQRTRLPCKKEFYFKVVKHVFQKRRKTLRNALKPINLPASVQNDPVLSKRPEQLSVDEFLSLTNKLERHGGINTI